MFDILLANSNMCNGGANVCVCVCVRACVRVCVLDLVITSANSTLSPTVISLPISPTDHFPIICSLKFTDPPTVLYKPNISLVLCTC